MELTAQMSLKELITLSQDNNKIVEIHLQGGKELSGTVVNVSDDAVVPGQLVGKEFYDAYILLNQIAAIELRMH